MAHHCLRSIGTILSSYSWSGSKRKNPVYYGDIVKEGYLIQQKMVRTLNSYSRSLVALKAFIGSFKLPCQENMRKRYFVLRKETSKDNPARLEYYSSKKKFRCGFLPKKTYILNRCFNISRKTDEKNFVIALYIGKGDVGLVAENEEDLSEWLQLLQFHKNVSAEEETKRKPARKDYEYVWKVKLINKKLGTVQNLTGHHWLCITDRMLSLVSVDNPETKKDLMISSVRKCLSRGSKFSLKMGRISATGSVMLVFQTENAFTARKIHSIVSSAFINRRRISCGKDSDKRRANLALQIWGCKDGIAALRKERRLPNSWPNERNSLAVSRQIHSDGDAIPVDRPNTDFGVKYPAYLPMEIAVRNKVLMFRKITDEDTVYYTPMDCGEARERPCYLPLLSPTTESTSLGSFTIDGTPGSACSGETSLWGGWSQSSSLTSSEDAHSKIFWLIDDVYVPIQSPVLVCATQDANGAMSPYLHMGRVPVQFAAIASPRTDSENLFSECVLPPRVSDTSAANQIDETDVVRAARTNNT